MVSDAPVAEGRETASVPSRAVPFAGRERELARLSELLTRVRGGESDCLVVEGAAGLGKSALLEQVARRASGLRVLRATGAETESELSFAALDALLRPVVDLRARLPEVQAGALERALALSTAPHRTRSRWARPRCRCWRRPQTPPACCA